jgi:hypothetical protein
LGLLGQILEHFTFEQDKLFSWLKGYNYCPLETFGCYCQIRLRRSLFLEFGKFSFKNFFPGMVNCRLQFCRKKLFYWSCAANRLAC